MLLNYSWWSHFKCKLDVENLRFVPQSVRGTKEYQKLVDVYPSVTRYGRPCCARAELQITSLRKKSRALSAGRGECHGAWGGREGGVTTLALPSLWRPRWLLNFSVITHMRPSVCRCRLPAPRHATPHQCSLPRPRPRYNLTTDHTKIITNPARYIAATNADVLTPFVE